MLYQEQTAAAVENFKLDETKTDLRLIYAIITVKKAAAITYDKLGVGKQGLYSAISSACDEVLEGKYDNEFVTQSLQGGAGTSTNMNVNEVLASIASKKLGYNVHPLDDVNKGQSTNDVYPTALRIAAINLIRELSKRCADLQESLQIKENEFGDIRKLGRTELMDAVEITLGEEFGAYAQAISRDRWRIYKVEERLRQVNIGGTAVGLSDNASKSYRFEVIEELRKLTGIGLASAEYPMDITQNNDVFVEVSGLLKALSVNLFKICNDLRLMNSGPNGGLGEIILKKLQNGSSIMPGKVNPVIPEMVMQVCMRVNANDYAISLAASHGEFELNAFLPLIAQSLINSLSLLSNAVYLLQTKCIETLKPNKQRCLENLEKSCAFATHFVPTLGYDCVSKVVLEHKNEPEKIREILENM